MQEKFVEKHDKYCRDPTLQPSFKYDNERKQTCDTRSLQNQETKFISDDGENLMRNYSNMNLPDIFNSLTSIIVEKDHNLDLPYSFEPKGVLDLNFSHMHSSEEIIHENIYSILKFEEAKHVRVN